MAKKEKKDEWNELVKQLTRLAAKQRENLESRLSKESRQAISQVEAAANVEARRAKASLQKLARKLETRGAHALRKVLDDFEKGEKKPAGKKAKKKPAKNATSSA